MQCVGSRLLWCPCGVAFCGRGAALVAAQETQRLPALRGSNQRAAAPATLFRPPGRPCRKESQTFGLIPFQLLWIATAVGVSAHARASPEPETTAGQPAPVSTKAPGTRDHCKGNRPPCLQKFLDLDPSRATGPRATQVFLPETTAGQPAPVSTKALLKLEHQGTTSPTGIQISPLDTKKWTTLQGVHCIK